MIENLAIASDGREARVRKIWRRRILTAKAPSAHGNEREEIEIALRRAEFRALWPVTRTRRLCKRRIRHRLGHHEAEIDVYAGRLQGLIIAEVEFTDRKSAAAFQPPDWFGREITADLANRNQALARRRRA